MNWKHDMRYINAYHIDEMLREIRHAIMDVQARYPADDPRAWLVVMCYESIFSGLLEDIYSEFEIEEKDGRFKMIGYDSRKPTGIHDVC